MAYLQSHQTLATHPKTRKAARRLSVSIPTMIGHLHLLWYWALDHAPDGQLAKFDADDLADAAGWDGDPDELVKALTDCGPGDSSGFLDGDGSLHDWAEYGGKYGKRVAAARKAAAARWQSDDDADASDGHSDGNANASDAHAEGNAEERRGEDKNLTLVGTADAVTDEDDRFEQFWDAYPRHHETNLKGGGGNKKTTRRRFGKLKRADQDEVLAAVGPYASVCLPGGRFPKNAERFLTDEFWKTYLEMPNPADDDEFVGGVRRVR